jgi:murein hydrolase activator
MHKKTSCHCLALSLHLIITLLTTPCHAAKPGPNKQHIQHLQNTLAQEKMEQKKIQNDFKRADEQVNTLNHSLHQTDQKLQQQQSSLDSLSQQKQTLHQQLLQQQNLSSQTLIHAYKMHLNPIIKMMLNQKDPQAISRMMHYYNYLNKNHLVSIDALQQTLIHLQETEQQMKVYQAALQHALNDQHKAKQQLQKTRDKRSSMLKKLEQSIRSKQQALKQLQQDKQALDTVVTHLTNEKRPPTKAFTANSLPWPTKGKVSQHFGTRVQASELKTHGIVINNQEGQPVYAIASGSVVFAKWMSGFGLLIIIQHDNGFMTLYGRNDSIEVEVGESIEAGDQIASVGHSGAFPQPGLYFEMRHGEKPIDPENLLVNTH